MDFYLQTLVLEGAKYELNDTDGSKVGNGYTRYEYLCAFAVRDVICFVSLKCSDFDGQLSFFQ